MKEKHARNVQETAVSAKWETTDIERVLKRGLDFIFPDETPPAEQRETFD